jgi:Ras GTPase-activating-like protein IQGAP2/3
MSVMISTSVSSSASSSTMTLPLTTTPRPRMSTFSSDSDRAARASKRHSVSKLYSMVHAEHDTEVEDELSRSISLLSLYRTNAAQKQLRELKGQISAQSKKNFLLERDVRYLDSRIALLIQNRMALDEQNEFAARIEDADTPNLALYPPDRKLQVVSFLMKLM